MNILSTILRRPYSGIIEPDSTWDGMDAAISLALSEPAPLRSDIKRSEIEAERAKIDMEEAEHFASIAYHEREIEKARKQLADLALCRDANGAAAAILNASRAVDIRALADDFGLPAEPAPLEVEKAA